MFFILSLYIRCKCGLCFASAVRCSVHVPDSRSRLLLIPLLTCSGLYGAALKFGGRMFTKSKCIPLEIVQRWSGPESWRVDLIVPSSSFLTELTNKQKNEDTFSKQGWKPETESTHEGLLTGWGLVCEWHERVVLKTGESKWKTAQRKSTMGGKTGTRSRTVNSPAGYQIYETENVWMSAEKYQRRWMKSHKRYEQSFLYISFWSNLTNGYPLYNFTWSVD